MSLRRLLFLLIWGAVSQSVALAGTDNVRTLVPFASPEGTLRFARSTAKSDFAPLANQFEAQSAIPFCGPTSAAIVLNALHPQDASAPRDGSRLLAADARHMPPGLSLAMPRHTQESVIARGAKTRAQVFGEPVQVDGKTVRDGGYQLRQFDQMLRANGARTRLVIADANVTDADIRRDLLANLERPGDYVIVNYRRAAVGQSGGGHISPLAAYDAESDSVLVLDVNPSNYPWVWMPLSVLVEGMRTKDVVENRGYVLVGERGAVFGQ